MQTEIAHALATLKAGNLLLYPTDTVWGIGCDASNAAAVEKVYRLKNRPGNKALICLVSDFDMLKHHVQNIPDAVVKIIHTSTRPTTIVYEHPVGIAKNLIGVDHSLAIRICHNPFCQKLIREFGAPIVSTSANISGRPNPKNFAQISPEIIKGVDYVVNLQREKEDAAPSRILKVETDGTITIIRE